MNSSPRNEGSSALSLSPIDARSQAIREAARRALSGRLPDLTAQGGHAMFHDLVSRVMRETGAAWDEAAQALAAVDAERAPSLPVQQGVIGPNAGDALQWNPANHPGQKPPAKQSRDAKQPTVASAQGNPHNRLVGAMARELHDKHGMPIDDATRAADRYLRAKGAK